MLILILSFLFNSQVEASGVYSPSKPSSKSKNELVEEKLGLNSLAIIQNSTPEWNDELVKVVEIFADGSRRLLRKNGEKILVRKKNLALSLSPKTADGCGTSHGTKICAGENVFYPALGTTLGIPEAKVIHVFENRRVIVRDGVDQVFNLSEIGKETNCSPQKPSVCQETYVLGDAYKKGARYSFEGPVEKVFTNGIVVVKGSAFWKFPIDVKAVNERVATTDQEIKNNRAVIMNRGAGAALKRDPASKVDVPVTRELEPDDVEVADQAEKSHEAR